MEPFNKFLRAVTIAAVANNTVFLLALLVAALLCGAMLLIVIQTKRRSGNWGLNLHSIREIIKGKPLLQKVACPKCGREQQDFRRPTNLTEILWGGWTCPDCGTKMDKWGQIRE